MTRQSIHKKLERAIQPDEVVIPVVTGEERIASKCLLPLISSDTYGLIYHISGRLLTMISGFRLLKTLGYCVSHFGRSPSHYQYLITLLVPKREFPVMGIEDDILIIGVIVRQIHQCLVSIPHATKQG